MEAGNINIVKSDNAIDSSDSPAFEDTEVSAWFEFKCFEKWNTWPIMLMEFAIDLWDIDCHHKIQIKRIVRMILLRAKRNAEHCWPSLELVDKMAYQPHVYTFNLLLLYCWLDSLRLLSSGTLTMQCHRVQNERRTCISDVHITRFCVLNVLKREKLSLWLKCSNGYNDNNESTTEHRLIACVHWMCTTHKRNRYVCWSGTTRSTLVVRARLACVCEREKWELFSRWIVTFVVVVVGFSFWYLGPPSTFGEPNTTIVRDSFYKALVLLSQFDMHEARSITNIIHSLCALNDLHDSQDTHTHIHSQARNIECRQHGEKRADGQVSFVAKS